MSVTYTWRIGDIESDENDDNFIRNVECHIYATKDGVTQKTQYISCFDGDKTSTGSDFRPYSDMIKAENETHLITWAKDALGATQVAHLESVALENINIYNNMLKLKTESSSNFPSLPKVTGES